MEKGEKSLESREKKSMDEERIHSPMKGMEMNR
jgi:hypothetical protein